jgi:hypothetical protein
MQFTYHGVEKTGFCHLYNLTWFNERTIELAVAFDFLEGRKGSGLEIGNVLGHYRPFTHHVIDRYERASWYQKQIIHNVDLFDVPRTVGLGRFNLNDRTHPLGRT